jgi:hypothetical protein
MKSINKHIHNRNRQQSGADTMTADIDQVNGKMIIIHPVVAKGITA